MVKRSVLPVKSCLSFRALVIWASLVILFMAGDVGNEESQRHYCRLCVASTPGHRSLGLDAAHRVAGL
jgi:hypothetical protein